MLLLKSSFLLLLTMLSNRGWATSSEPEDDTQNYPKLEYKELFPPSHLPNSSGAEIFHVVDGAIKALERPHYYWLLSSLAKFEIVTSDDPTASGNPLLLITRVTSTLDAVRYADDVALFAELDIKIDKHVDLHKPQESGTSPERYSEALKTWEEKYGDKRRRYEDFRGLLISEGFSGELLKIFVYELAFFLKLISFETALEALRKRREKSEYTRVLVNILGDSLLDGGKQFDQFYEQFETASGAIGYSLKVLQKFEQVVSSDVAGAFRDIIGELISVKKYGPEQRVFMERMWRATCTLHLAAILQYQWVLWDEEFASMLYRAIDVGSTEVFDAGYKMYDDDKFIGGHNMLVEVQKSTESSYHVRQFNSENKMCGHERVGKRHPKICTTIFKLRQHVWTE